MGVIGEYLAQVLAEVKGRPLFILESDQHFPSNILRDAAEAL
jgi:hypothetical protein